MFRPLITCDDKKGVVECGTIRKSKSCVQKTEDKIEKNIIEKHSKKASKTDKIEKEMFSKGVIDEHQNPSSCQLPEISSGAQKLNWMIDALSKGMSYGGRPKDIAKDMLKGAFDLQESIVMLGKLHEASDCISKSKKKHKEKTGRGRIDEVERDRGSLDQFGDRIGHNGYEKPRLSEDGSSRNDIEELKKAIRDGLARRHLLPSLATQETTYSGGRKMDMAFDVPSTSSRQPSLDQFNFGHVADCCSTLPKVPQKEKGPNVIARLMGLEEFPLKPLQKHAQEKQVSAEKMQSPCRPAFEIEMPKLRKPQHIAQNEDSKQRTLEEVLETMHFKGLLKSSSVKLLKLRSYQSGEFYSNQRTVDDIPPIVLIKPMRGTRTKSEELRQSSGWEEETLNRKMMLRKSEMPGCPISTNMAHEESNLSASRMHYKTGMWDDRAKHLSQKGAWDFKDEFVDVEVKEEVRTVDEKERAAAVKLHKKLEVKDSSKKRLTKVGAKDQMEAIARVEENDIGSKLKSSSRSKTSSPVAHQHQLKQEIVDKRVDKIQTVAPAGKKTMERETLKPKKVSSSHDQAKETPRNPKKLESTSSITQNDVAREQNVAQKMISKCTTDSRNHSSKYQKRKEKAANGTIAAKVSTENLGQKEYVKEINLVHANDSLGRGFTHSVGHQPSPDQENANAIKVDVEGHGNESQSSLCDVIIPVSQCRNDVESIDEANANINHHGRDGTRAENQLKTLLLSSQSFLRHADELFHVETGSTGILPASAIDDLKAAELKLVLHYANEYIEQRSLPHLQAALPLLPTYRDYLRVTLSVDQLVEEICVGTETLRSYSKVAADTLYAALERDMRCKGVVTRTWELGWINGFSVDDIEQTVIDVENQLLSELINEIFA